MELVVQRDESMNIGQRLGGFRLSFARQQDHELITADARHRSGRINRLVQHFAHSAQYGVACGVTLAVVDCLQVVQVEHNEGQELGALASQTIEFVNVERAVLQLG